MPYEPGKHGRADYGSFMQLTPSQVAAIAEGADTPPLTAQKFANLVYQVNPTPVVITGGISIGDVKIIDVSGHMVEVTPSGAMQVHDKEVVDAVNALSSEFERKYSQIVRVSGDLTFVMKAEPSSGGIVSGDPVWQVFRISEDNAGNLDMMYADGDRRFDNIAANYATLTYSF